MKKLILLLFLTGLTATAAWAQNEVTVKQIEEIIQDADGNSVNVSRDDLFNKFSAISAISNLQQLGSEASHVANITIHGDNNTATITQKNGIGNIGAIDILGEGNKSSLLQDGNNLLSLIRIQGDNNKLDVTQDGNNLGNLVQVDGVDYVNIDITQNEQGLQYTQEGGNSIPLVMTSTRRNVPIIIRNN